MIKQLLIDSTSSFTKGELKIVHELLENYPSAGLGTAANLAQGANVSPATVVRLITKLGFEGFGEFQQALREELNETMKSPLSMIEQRKSVIQSNDIFTRYINSVTSKISNSAEVAIAISLDRATKIISNRSLNIVCLGGRFSFHLAAILHIHLQQLRSGTELWPEQGSNLFDHLIDINKKSVLVVFDYRRYQRDIVELAFQAKERNAKIILFTDTYKSPIHKISEIVITSPVEVISPFDTMVHALVATEALIAGVTGVLSETASERMTQLEAYRYRNKVSLEPEE